MTPAARHARCSAALLDPNVVAFLRMLRWCEGTAGEHGYRMHFGGEVFESLADHPRRAITRTLGGRPITSTAAGAYQFLQRTWDECVAALGLRDFGSWSQDLAAVYLIDRRRALQAVIDGDIERAVELCAREWASLPGSPYGQPVKTMRQVLARYTEAGGRLRGETPPAPPEAPAPAEPVIRTLPEEPSMPIPAIVAALLPTLIAKIPELVQISDSKGDERRDKALALAVDVATQAVGARNAQEAAELIERDPQMAAAAREAVRSRWLEITEVGGGIEAAARRNAEQPPPARNMAVWATAGLLPLVYMVVAAVMFGDGWSDDVRAMTVAAVVTGVLGAITGYWLGTSMSSARKDEALIVGRRA